MQVKYQKKKPIFELNFNLINQLEFSGSAEDEKDELFQ